MQAKVQETKSLFGTHPLLSRYSEIICLSPRKELEKNASVFKATIIQVIFINMRQLASNAAALPRPSGGGRLSIQAHVYGHAMA